MQCTFVIDVGLDLGRVRRDVLSVLVFYTEQIKMKNYIKNLHKVIFTGPTGCGKNHLVLNMIEKECNNHLDFIIIICQTLHCWIRHDEYVWLIEPKDKLYHCIEKLPFLSSRSEILFIIDDAVADESLDKRDNPY